jgi:hypothetical protein
MFIHERYPRLKSLKYRKRGKRYIFRAKWACRVLYAFGPSPEYAMSRFLLEILRKVFTERLMTREEYRAVRQELHRREIMSYAVYETVEK